MTYDQNKWELLSPSFKPTLQFFITNRCNRKCKACFYADYMHEDHTGAYDMDLGYYQEQVNRYYNQNIKKIILIGGEPTLHKDLARMILFNRSLGLETTVYTNGTHMKPLEHFAAIHGLDGVSIRVGVLGFSGMEKNLIDVKTKLPIMVCFMARRDNLDELAPIIRYGSLQLNLTGIMISSIRDMVATGTFWEDTDETLSNEEFAEYAQMVVNSTLVDLYRFGIKSLHICRRAVFDGLSSWKKCRYNNFHVDGSKTICPFDISAGVKDGEGYRLNTRPCNKNHECILQKNVLMARPLFSKDEKETDLAYTYHKENR